MSRDFFFFNLAQLWSFRAKSQVIEFKTVSHGGGGYYNPLCEIVVYSVQEIISLREDLSILLALLQSKVV